MVPILEASTDESDYTTRWEKSIAWSTAIGTEGFFFNQVTLPVTLDWVVFENPTIILLSPEKRTCDGGAS